ncbi:hypothetical protein OAR53_03585 [Luminiphilus sp.]|nr:hypothetical protein [Luminiphilus sp.]
MKILGWFFLALGGIDFLASLVGTDFYLEYLGINLTGLAYQYSPLIAGIIGGALLQFGSGTEA